MPEDHNGGHKAVLLKEYSDRGDNAEHCHSAVEIASPLRGELTAVCSRGHFSLNENDIILIPSDEPHRLCSDGEYIVIQCDDTALSGNPALSELMPALSEPFIIGAENVPRGLIGDIRALYESSSPASETRVYIKFLELLAVVAESRNVSEEPHNEKNSAKLRLALNYIDKNYMYDISLDELANASGYSKFHFSRLFRKFSGMSLPDYLNRRRIREAALLLEKTDMTVTDAAMKSGFSSITTFNRVFKLIQGCTPSEFKKRANNRNY